MSESAVIDWARIREIGGIYPQAAYDFVRRGLMHTVKLVHGEEALRGEPDPDDESRHVNGQQLCFGLKDYAISRYGLMARTVFAHWSIHRTEDFGRIVFAMVEGGLMRKTERDRFEDFQGVYDFDDAFGSLEPSEHAA